MTVLRWGRSSPAKHHLARYALRRVLAGAVMLGVISVVVFAATSLLPGDAAVAALGKGATPENLAEVRHELGVDRPPVERYVDWAGGLTRGDLGTSIQSRQPVADVIGERLGNSAILALVTAALLVPLALLLGAISGARPRRRFDRVVMSTSLVAIALPEFVAGSILIFLLALQLGLFPPVSLYAVGQNPLSEPSKLVLPILTLLTISLAQTTRLVRAGVMETMRAEYVQMARLKGVPESAVLRRHALRNALIPAVPVIALALQYLVGGIVVTEIVFNYPGIGSALIQAVATRDFPVVQACALFVAVVYVGLNIVADLLVVFLTPKLRTR